MTLNDAMNAMAVAAQATESDVHLLVQTLRKLVFAVEFGSGSYPDEMKEAWDVVVRFSHVKDQLGEPEQQEVCLDAPQVEF